MTAKVSGVPWSEKEDEFLRVWTERLPRSEIATSLGRTAKSVAQRQRRLGLSAFRDRLNDMSPNAILIAKSCSNCGVLYPAEFYSKVSNRPAGRRSSCRICDRKKDRERKSRRKDNDRQLASLSWASRTYLPWLPEEDELLMKIYDSIEVLEVSRLLNRTYFSVIRRVADNRGVHRQHVKHSTPWEIRLSPEVEQIRVALEEEWKNNHSSIA